MRFNEVKRLIKESQEEDLFEVNMSPSNLEKLANQIDALAGMEFEMIVPNVGTTDDEGDLEPDYDQDERIRRFSDITEFFNDGEYNSRRDVESLTEEIWEAYMDSDWLSEKKQTEWDEVVEDHIRDLVERDYGDEYLEQAEEEVKKQAPEFGMNGEELQQAIQARYKELFLEKVDEIMSDMGEEYDKAFEEWQDEEWPEIWNDDDMFTDWADSEGIRTMSDINDRYNITWPHWESRGSDGEANVEEVADEFSHAIQRKINWSTNYHGAKRAPDRYVVEPDGSLDPDDDDDAGLEFVSPPLKLDEILDDLDKVKAWADKRGCYTNKSTGLHINVSVPGLTTESLDYVKLALLLGDKYVLDQFDRAGNSYAKSAMDMVKDRVRQRPEDAAALLNKMKQGLGQLATKIIHSGETSKYTSINTKGGYVEFRSPGGDWLSDDFFKKIKPTLLRFVVALDAALDPEKYREEYLKKLYQLLQPKSQTDTLSYFAKYAAGELPKAALKSFVRQVQLERNIKKSPAGTGEKYWWRVEIGDVGAEVVASSKEEAWEKAKRLNPSWLYSDQAEITPLRPYEEKPASPTLGGRPSNPDGNWLIVDRNRRPVYRFMAANQNDAETVWLQWSREYAGTWELKYDPDRELNQSPQAVVPRRAQGEFTGAWQIVDDTGRELHRFSGVGNSQADANRVAVQWLRDNDMGVSMEGRYSVLPVMR